MIKIYIIEYGFKLPFGTIYLNAGLQIEVEFRKVITAVLSFVIIYHQERPETLCLLYIDNFFLKLLSLKT